MRASITCRAGILAALAYSLTAFAPVSAHAAETNAAARAESNASSLTTENRLLREENQKLREELVQTPAPDKNAKLTTGTATSSVTTNGAVLYWVSYGSRKRHNPTCKYYKKSKGYLTTKKEGIPCKICGG